MELQRTAAEFVSTVVFATLEAIVAVTVMVEVPRGSSATVHTHGPVVPAGQLHATGSPVASTMPVMVTPAGGVLI